MNKLFILQIIFLSFLLVSCDDLFHDANSILEDIETDIEEIIEPDPIKIILGGDFKYSFNEIDHESIIVLDGEGNYIENAFDQSVYGLYGDGTGYSGVRDIELTSDYLYVSGQFQGYKNTPDTNYMRDDYAYLMRYTHSGGVYTYDSNYKPASIIPDYSGSILEINPLMDGSLVLGGSFSSGLNPYFSIIKPDGSEYSPLPVITIGYSVNAMYYFSDDSIMFIAGDFNEINGVPDYMEYALIDIDSGAAIPPGAFLEGSAEDPLAVTEIYDVEFTGNQELFIAGHDMNASTTPYWLPGVFRKYIYNGTNFISDADFNSQFRDVELIRDADSDPMNSPYFNSVKAIATDSEGRIYIGGEFSNIKDINGNEHKGIIRLFASGMIDPTFTPDINLQVIIIEFQKNGKIIVGGSTIGTDMGNNGYVRLMPDGNIDESFHLFGIPPSDMAMSPTIYSIVIEEQPIP